LSNAQNLAWKLKENSSYFGSCSKVWTVFQNFHFYALSFLSNAQNPAWKLWGLICRGRPRIICDSGATLPGGNKRAWNVIWNDPDRPCQPNFCRSIEPNDNSGEPLDESSPTIMKCQMKVTKIPWKHTQKQASTMGNKRLPQLAPPYPHTLSLSFAHSTLWSISSQVTSPWPQTFGKFRTQYPRNSQKIASLKPPHPFVVVAGIRTLHSSGMPCQCHCHCYLWDRVSNSLFSSSSIRRRNISSTILLEYCGRRRQFDQLWWRPLWCQVELVASVTGFLHVVMTNSDLHPNSASEVNGSVEWVQERIIILWGGDHHQFQLLQADWSWPRALWVQVMLLWVRTRTVSRLVY
jgi:hypothetical protein